MKKILIKLIRLIIPFKSRVKLFWKYNSIKLVLSSTYNVRTEENLTMANEFNKFINKLDPEEKEGIIRKLTKNLNEDSKTEVTNFIKRNKYIAENNLINTIQQFSKKELMEQNECSKDSQATRKKINKYKIEKYAPESFFGLSGLRWAPQEIKNKLKGGIFLDIGAYDGDSSIALLENFYPQKIYAFEPESNNFIKLKNNSEIEGKNTLVPIKFGASNYNGQATISNQANGSKIISNNSGEKIDIITIDKFCEDNNINEISLIKMDIEGDEMKALKGAKETILKHRPVLAISIYHNAHDFFFIKPWIEELYPDYKFIIKKAHPFILTCETMLIAYRDESAK